jgi:5'-nucleotidase
MSTTIRKALVSVSALALSAGAAQAFTLDILHINDLHSRIEPINAFDSTCSVDDDAAGECFGGVARVKTMIDERREALSADGGNVLVLDAGDQFQGSLFYTTYKGEAAAEFMNMIGFDAMAIGNHEFDDGPENLAEFIEKVEVPLISGNTIAAEGSVLDGAYEPYVIEEFGEERVAILSVLATDTDETSSPGDQISFTDEIEYLRGAVEEVTAEGIDKIILLSHVGLPRDREIAAAVEGIDVIVGGHSHTLLSNEAEGAAGPYPVMVANPAGTDVPIVQAYAYSKYVGELRVEFDEEGNVISAAGEPHLLDASVEQDQEVAARVAELRAPIEELMSEYVADTTASIDGSRETCRAAECEMGNLVTDAMLAHTADQGVELVITNGGGLRASIDEGEITMGEVIAVLPFQNTLATFEITGAGIIEALENGVSQYEEQGGRFAQVAGMRYTFDPTQPAGSRIVSVEVADGNGGFAPIDEAETYLVATNNYMRNGGDGYEIFATEGENAYDYGPGLEQVVADYLRENTPYEPYLEGRIVNAAASGEAAAGATTDEPAAEADAAAPASEPADTASESTDAAGTNAAAPAEDAASEPPADAAEAPTAEDSASEAPATDAAGTETNAASGETAEPAPAEEEPAATEPASEDAAAEEPAPTPETAPAEDEAAMTEEEDTATGDAPADTAAEEEATADPITPAPAEEESAADPIEPAPAEEEEEAMADPIEAAPATDDERQHTVARGDTYWDIAEEYYGDGEMWQTIAEANPEMPEQDLEIGATLTIPPLQ